MSAEPKIACCRLGNGPAGGDGTRDALERGRLRSARSAFPRRARRRARRGRRGRRGSTTPARPSRWPTRPRDRRARSGRCPRRLCTSPLASQATNHKPAATGGQSHQRGCRGRARRVAASTGVPKVASRARPCGPCGTRSMMSTPAPSSAAGTASQIQLRPDARAWRAGAATVAACAAQSTAYDGTKESVIPRCSGVVRVAGRLGQVADALARDVLRPRVLQRLR